MGDLGETTAASAVSTDADNATESEACGIPKPCADLCLTAKEPNLVEANYDSNSDESHQPNQVNQLTEQIRSHLNIDESKASEDEIKQDPKTPKKPKSHVKIPKTQAELEELYESILRSTSTNKESTYTQILDADLNSEVLKLKDCARDITRRMGLHVPILCMNSKNYCTMMQMNDGGMDYFSLLQVGGPRLWLIVPQEDNEKLEQVAVELLKKIKVEEPAEVDNEWLPDCHTPLMHKRIALTPKQLREGGIRFEIFAQYAGDIVYLKHHLFHQVVDMDLNINETANAGNDVWMEKAFEFDICACNHEGVRALDLSPYKDILREHYMKARKNAKAGRSKRK